MKANTLNVKTFCAIGALVIGGLLVNCGGGGGGGSSASAPAPDNEKWDPTTLLASMGNEVMPYIYDELVDEAMLLQTQTVDFCAAPTAQRLADLQAQWLVVSTRWLNSTAVLFGPAIEDNRDFSINVVAKASTIINDVINAATPVNITEADIELLGSQAKGLHAIEFLLYDTDRLNPTAPLNDTAAVLAMFTSDINAARRCGYLLALTAHLQTQLTDIQSGWQVTGENFAGDIVNAGVAGSVYLSQEQAVEEIVNKLAQSVERFKNISIGTPLGKKSNDVTKPFDAEHWRSQESIANLRAHLDGLERIYLGLDSNGNDVYGFDDQVQQLGFDNLHIAIVEQFARVRTALDEIDGSLYEAVDNDKADVEETYLAAEALVALLKREMSTVLDVTIGFTSDDGD